MSSRFDELCRTHLDPYVDEHYGELVQFLPMLRTPNGRAAPDPDRRETKITAVVHLTPHRPSIEREARAASKGGNNSLRSIVEGTASQLSVQARLFANPEDRPRQGDYVECAAGRFEIVTAQSDGTGRIVCKLASIGSTAL